jgi:hypothetical protein
VCTYRVRGWGRVGGKVAINLDHHNLPAPPTEMTNKNPFYRGDKQTAFPIFQIKGFHKLYLCEYLFACFCSIYVCNSTVNISCNLYACTFVSILEYSKE